MFYTFNQNNSGGDFEVNDLVAQYVVIEANDIDHASEIAEGIGIYFDGCDKGIDCPCCGDRWYLPWTDTGTNEPLIYGQPPDKTTSIFCKKGDIVCHVHYLNSPKVTYRAK